jgi:hypothetical protein
MMEPPLSSERLSENLSDDSGWCSSDQPHSGQRWRPTRYRWAADGTGVAVARLSPEVLG